MKTAVLKPSDARVRSLIDAAGDDVLFLTQSGLPVAALVSINGPDAESIAVSRSPKFQAILRRAKRQIESGNTIPFEEVRRRLGIPNPPTSKRRPK